MTPRTSARHRRLQRAFTGALLGSLALLAAGCGGGSAGSSADAPGTGSCDRGSLVLTPQNSTLLPGVNRITVALNRKDRQQSAVADATATLDIQGAAGTFETRPLQYVGHRYGDIPVYVGTARFDAAGDYRYVVHATVPGGQSAEATACVTVTTKSPELPVGFDVPRDVRQPIVGSPAGVTPAMVDSGVPPDGWHDTTIADGLAQHRPMVLFFAQPGRCPTATCGPSLGIVQQLAQVYGDRLLFEHIEVHYPASAGSLNQAYVRFGLQSDPWVYFVNAAGKVSDRFEGPITLDELSSAADGTLAGRVPATDVRL